LACGRRSKIVFRNRPPRPELRMTTNLYATIPWSVREPGSKGIRGEKRRAPPGEPGDASCENVRSSGGGQALRRSARTVATSEMRASSSRMTPSMRWQPGHPVTTSFRPVARICSHRF